MTTIDVHAPFLPAFHRDSLLAAGLGQADGIARLPPWDIGSALHAMDRLSIETAILSVSSPGVHFGDDNAARNLARRVNEEAARLTRTHSGRFGFFASTPLPETAGAVAEMRCAFDALGADGIVPTGDEENNGNLPSLLVPTLCATQGTKQWNQTKQWHQICPA